MIRRLIILLYLLKWAFASQSQLCPGGGVDFNSAVWFDPAWIYDCSTGTSCNGGVVLDNRAACEPVTAMNVCAPSPSCGIAAENGSDIWFKFYPYSSSVAIASIQNTSFITGIQAFEGSACGSLTEIGCALSDGPSGGVQLHLNGLSAGAVYYYRIFGSSSQISQRTGLYCFCGTTGLAASVLPISLQSIKGKTLNNKVELSFLTPSFNDSSVYEIEHSADAVIFSRIYQITSLNIATTTNKITYIHSPKSKGINYYRLKQSTANAQSQYSSTIKVNLIMEDMFFVNNMAKKQITIKVDKNTTLKIADASGRLLKSFILTEGLHHISVADLRAGIYMVRNSENGQTYKFAVLK